MCQVAEYRHAGFLLVRDALERSEQAGLEGHWGELKLVPTDADDRERAPRLVGLRVLIRLQAI